MSKTIIQSQKNRLLDWNLTFPLDIWWRRKYKIPLFSEKHLDANQFDIALEYIEEKMFKEWVEQSKEKSTETNSMFKDYSYTEKEEELFTSLNVTQLDLSTHE